MDSLFSGDEAASDQLQWTQHEGLNIDAILEADLPDLADWFTNPSSPGRQASWGLPLPFASGFAGNDTARAAAEVPPSETLSSDPASQAMVAPPGTANATGPSSALPDGPRERKPRRVRGKPTEQQRAKASMMRKIGNCLRCRAFKLAVGHRELSGVFRVRRLTRVATVGPQHSMQAMPERVEQRPIVP
jgi:hypothetical protein